MPSLTYYVVDAFTKVPFKGNAAAVVILDPDSQHSDTLLQSIAAEFNLSETAFAVPINKEKGLFHLRWFTPKTEVNLCGHATLATADVLFSNRELVGLAHDITRLEFETKNAGILVAEILQDGRIELEFPTGEIRPIDAAETRERISTAISTAFSPDPPKINFLGDGKGTYRGYLFVEIDANYDLEGHSVNSDGFKSLAPAHEVIIVSQRSITRDSEDFKSRVFGPTFGIPEDPVTGSAHSFIAPYWHKALAKDPEAELRGKQVSLRSGEIALVVDGERCKLRGNAALFAKGEFFYS